MHLPRERLVFLQFEVLAKDIAVGKVADERSLVEVFNGEMAEYYVVVGRLVNCSRESLKSSLTD